MKKFNAEKFENDFIDIVENLADALEVDPVIFIENIVISRLAADRAADDVYQGGAALMPEFMQHDGKMLRGRELYKMLYNLERVRLEREYIASLAALPVEALSDHDLEILKRHGQDQAAAAKRKEEEALFKEYEAELKEQGLKPFYTSQDLEKE